MRFRLPTLRAFVRNRQAVSAIEFALILPIMLTLYFGGVELGDALTINRKVTHITSTIADLVTQSKTLSDTDMTNILNASSTIAAPYSTGQLTIRVSEIKIDATTGKTTVIWSDARNTTALAKGTVVSIPAAVAVKGTWVVMAEVHYAYKPYVGYIMTGSFDLTDKFYLRPRLTDCVKRPGSSTACT